MGISLFGSNTKELFCGYTPGTSYPSAIICFAHTFACHLSDVYLTLHHSFAPASVTSANNSHTIHWVLHWNHLWTMQVSLSLRLREMYMEEHNTVKRGRSCLCPTLYLPIIRRWLDAFAQSAQLLWHELWVVPTNELLTHNSHRPTDHRHRGLSITYWMYQEELHKFLHPPNLIKSNLWKSIHYHWSNHPCNKNAAKWVHWLNPISITSSLVAWT